MSMLSWGNYPRKSNKTFRFSGKKDLRELLIKVGSLIPFGNGRSYGDSALAENILETRQRKYFISFDENKGEIHVQSGVLLSEILELIVPKGWFLKVTPGTKLITVGGAIAADVHGKNHHVAGCFSESVISFSLMLGDGEIVECSTNKNQDLFHATCGGMGLTGIILDAKLKLKKVNSKNIEQITIKTNNLQESFEAFEKYKDMPYSVAWIDCLAKGDSLGRCLLMVGDFADDGELDYKDRKMISVPFDFPSFSLNTLSVKLFNFAYFQKTLKKVSHQKVGIDTFFYPLDVIDHWNRIYGKKGFTQYQFNLPKETSFGGMKEILEAIAESGKGSFLAVLKLYGKRNQNYLSFPIEGYGLALDFKIEDGLFDLLARLDEIVVKHKGTIYLAKDVRVSKEVFEAGYPQIEKFRKLRKKYDLVEKFSSLQSRRVGI